ncbi:DUF6562 domain-containing protein [Phocaeicola plebeius]|uniref:DUF6562 domain-containing protein n=1 Tax=Phocaeicola plebeius TaxID=310297 RepID=UPI002942E172|nr:DUF6562 domain-containing protein [Phocaeicola plebeius]
MKKILLYSTLALGVGLCSCSQEDLGESPAQAVGQPVTVSVQLPGEVGNDGLSRAVPSIPADHKLRCILFVSDNVEGTADIRQEVIAENANDIAFTFIPPADTYTCSFWADFVKAEADGDGTYDDLYYNTQNLPNVTFAENAPLFNNEACDAFTGHFTANDLTNGTVTLKRPFAKVNFIAKEDITSVSSVSVSSYSVYNGVDIMTGAINTDSKFELSCTSASVADATNKVLFFNYLFADGTSTKLPANISMTLDNGVITSISTQEMVLAANTLYNLSTSVISDEVDTDPKVGDYFYTDGTWSTELESNKTVAGVVFAVKGDGTESAIDSDVTGNYPGVEGATDVLAWVLAAKDASTAANVKFYSGSDFSLPEGIGTGDDDIKGYENTALWLALSGTDYSAVSVAKSYDVTLSTGEDVLTSGWYLPSLGQMRALSTVYAETNAGVTTSLAVKKSLESLVEVTMAGNYWTSTGGMNDGVSGAYRVAYSDGAYSGCALRTGDNLQTGSCVRSVLTIFSKQQ